MKGIFTKNLKSKNAFTIQFQKRFFNQVPDTVKEKTGIDKWDHLSNLKPNEYALIQIRKKLEDNFKRMKLDKAMSFEWELNRDLYEKTGAIHHARNIESLLEVVKTYHGLVDSAEIFKQFYKIATFGDYNREVFTVLIPILKDYMRRFDRQNINELYYGAMAAAELNIADVEFWGIVEGKLVNEKQFKYLSLEQTVNLSSLLHEKERISLVLAKLFELELIKQRKALHLKPKLLKIAKKTYLGQDEKTPYVLKSQVKSSQVLREALVDPTIEVTFDNDTQKLH